MKTLFRLLTAGIAVGFLKFSLAAQTPKPAGTLISPTQLIASGKATHMEVKKIKDSADEKVYVIIFHAGDEVLSGLTDFAVQNKVQDGHFTAIGAARKATLGWLDLSQKAYRSIPVRGQSEVVSMIGDIAVFKGKPAIHTHAVLGERSGKTVGGHVWELIVDPTLEVFLTVNNTPLEKEPDNASGLNLIETKQ
jgi:uncharacterized protein